MGYNPEFDDACIELDHRFATNVMPDAEEAAELEAQDVCESVIDGQTCAFRLGAPQEASCLRTKADMQRVGAVVTRVVFDSMVNNGLADLDKQ